MAGHAVGLSGEPWAEHWLAARREAGLDAGVDDCLMPAPLPGGGSSKARLSTSEACVWLRELMVTGGLPADVAMRYSAHSMKATLLAWAACFPLSHDERRVLGGHIKPGDRSVLVYSRDAIAGPLRSLEVVLNRVASGEFRPDAPRGQQQGSGRPHRPPAPRRSPPLCTSAALLRARP